MDSIEVTAKKVDDAIEEGLKQLNATLDDVDVSVLDSGGFFRKAKIRMTLTEEVQAVRDAQRAKIEEEERLEREQEQKAMLRAQAAKQHAPQHTNAPQQQNAQKGGTLPKEGASAAVREAKAENVKAKAEGKREKQPRAGENKPQQSERRPQQSESRAADTGVKVEVKPDKDKSDEPSAVDPEKTDAAVKFVEKVTSLMGVQPVGAKASAHGRDVDITLETEDGAVIGYRGETLDAIEYLTGLIINKDSEKYIRVSLDCNSYRNKREEALVRLAEKMAAKCVKTGRKAVLEPMSSASRKVIHAALSDNDKITTKSEGKEPNRRVVIYCKRENSHSAVK